MQINFFLKKSTTKIHVYLYYVYITIINMLFKNKLNKNLLLIVFKVLYIPLLIAFFININLFFEWKKKQAVFKQKLATFGNIIFTYLPIFATKNNYLFILSVVSIIKLGIFFNFLIFFINLIY